MNKTKIVRCLAFLILFLIAGGFYLYTANLSEEETFVQGVVTNTNSKELETITQIAKISEKTKEVAKEVAKEVTKESEPFVQLENANVIYVHVCGSVVSPGVYELSKKARVIDAITKANGFCEGAAEDAINQAQLLIDGQRLYIPSQVEIEEGTVIADMTLEVGIQEQNENLLIDINQASKQELMTLPGIGESKAESIISYREEHDGFQSIEDIQKIVGIKEAIFQKVKDYITVMR